MKKIILFIGVMICTMVVYNNCNGYNAATSFGSTGSQTSTAGALPITGTEAYVLPITITSGGVENVNIPFVTVKVCTPGTSNCVTIPNVLLDTGSYGLRVFSSLVTSLNLQQVIDSSGHHVAECVSYGDGSSDWGPVVKATVGLNGETATSVPIQLINANFGTAPSDCTDLDSSPAEQHFNGILGVGLFSEDCGDGCATTADNRWYFDCTLGASSCSNVSVTVPDAYQVTNPIALLPMDNQGVIVQLPAISVTGNSAAAGFLIMGIGSEAHNTPPSGTVTFAADENANFQTIFEGQTYNTAIIDSGSNGLYFPQTAALTLCTSSDDSGWFCPTSTQTLTATQMDANGVISAGVTFQIMNSDQVFATSYAAFDDLGAPASDTFDWGLPFFYGRTIYVGLENKTSPLGIGPYWAY